MNPERLHELLARKTADGADGVDSPRIEPLTVPSGSTDFALELLVQEDGDRLAGGELLCLFEEAALEDLCAAVAERRDARRRDEVVVTPEPKSLAVPDAGVLSDRVRKTLWPEAPSAADWVGQMRDQRLAGDEVAVDFLIGHCETQVERVEHLLRVRDFHEHSGGLAALVVQVPRRSDAEFFDSDETWNSLRDRRDDARDDLLRTIALARLALDRGPRIALGASVSDPLAIRQALGSGVELVYSDSAGQPSVLAEDGKRTLTGPDLERIIAGAGYRPRSEDRPPGARDPE